ncbi:MAG: MarR family transcriptional regulator [Clostridia bacterium]|nr:MarR family transcriptional regulator [Clostridia bacterium]
MDLDLALSKQEIFALLLVERHGEIIMSQIASYVNIPMSTATGIVDRLVKNDYLVRERSESDRRIVVIKLTPKGKALMDSIKKKGTDYIQLIQQGLTEEERDAIYRIFIKILDIINKNQSESQESTGEEQRIKRIDIE